MVYEKNKSGDPDYDDKQPPEFHAGGQVVTAGDGVYLTPYAGPVDENGAHVNLDLNPEDLDNRPSPGNVASASSLVQDYVAEDTPTVGKEVEADSKDVDTIKAGQKATNAAMLASSGLAPKDDAPAKDEDTSPAKRPTSPAKSTPAR